MCPGFGLKKTITDTLFTSVLFIDNLFLPLNHTLKVTAHVPVWQLISPINNLCLVLSFSQCASMNTNSRDRRGQIMAAWVFFLKFTRTQYVGKDARWGRQTGARSSSIFALSSQGSNNQPDSGCDTSTTSNCRYISMTMAVIQEAAGYQLSSYTAPPKTAAEHLSEKYPGTPHPTLPPSPPTSLPPLPPNIL